MSSFQQLSKNLSTDYTDDSEVESGYDLEMPSSWNDHKRNVQQPGPPYNSTSHRESKSFSFPSSQKRFLQLRRSKSENSVNRKTPSAPSFECFPLQLSVSTSTDEDDFYATRNEKDCYPPATTTAKKTPQPFTFQDSLDTTPPGSTIPPQQEILQDSKSSEMSMSDVSFCDMRRTTVYGEASQSNNQKSAVSSILPPKKSNQKVESFEIKLDNSDNECKEAESLFDERKALDMNTWTHKECLEFLKSINESDLIPIFEKEKVHGQHLRVLNRDWFSSVGVPALHGINVINQIQMVVEWHNFVEVLDCQYQKFERLLSFTIGGGKEEMNEVDDAEGSPSKVLRKKMENEKERKRRRRSSVLLFPQRTVDDMFQAISQMICRRNKASQHKEYYARVKCELLAAKFGVIERLLTKHVIRFEENLIRPYMTYFCNTNVFNGGDDDDSEAELGRGDNDGNNRKRKSESISSCSMLPGDDHRFSFLKLRSVGEDIQSQNCGQRCRYKQNNSREDCACCCGGRHETLSPVSSLTLRNEEFSLNRQSRNLIKELLCKSPRSESIGFHGNGMLSPRRNSSIGDAQNFNAQHKAFCDFVQSNEDRPKAGGCISIHLQNMRFLREYYGEKKLIFVQRYFEKQFADIISFSTPNETKSAQVKIFRMESELRFDYCILIWGIGLTFDFVESIVKQVANVDFCLPKTWIRDVPFTTSPTSTVSTININWAPEDMQSHETEKSPSFSLQIEGEKIWESGDKHVFVKKKKKKLKLKSLKNLFRPKKHGDNSNEVELSNADWLRLQKLNDLRKVFCIVGAQFGCGENINFVRSERLQVQVGCRIMDECVEMYNTTISKMSNYPLCVLGEQFQIQVV